MDDRVSIVYTFFFALLSFKRLGVTEDIRSWLSLEKNRRLKRNRAAFNFDCPRKKGTVLIVFSFWYARAIYCSLFDLYYSCLIHTVLFFFFFFFTLLFSPVRSASLSRHCYLVTCLRTISLLCLRKRQNDENRRKARLSSPFRLTWVCSMLELAYNHRKCMEQKVVSKRGRESTHMNWLYNRTVHYKW